MKAEPTYRVTTWDHNHQKFTPQVGVSPGPYTKWQLRRALRQLRAMSYDVKRCIAYSVLVERVD